MRKVVDTNVLDQAILRTYLARTESNRAVLTDYAAMEIYKGGTPSGVSSLMQVLIDYPRQVDILKSTRIVCGLNGRGSGLQQRLIDHGQTNDFPSYCRDLERALSGNVQLTNALRAHSDVANSHLDSMLGDAAALPDIFAEYASVFTKTELTFIRKKQAFTEEMIDKTINCIIWLAANMFKEHPDAPSRPPEDQLPNLFIFRFAICSCVLAIDWIAEGGAKGTKPERLRNDIVDANFATYATFFDGFLTNDQKAQRLYDQACILLRHFQDILP